MDLQKKLKGNKGKLEELEDAYSILTSEEGKEEEGSPNEEEGEGNEDEGIQNLFDILRGGRGGKMQKPRRSKMKPMHLALEATLDDIHSGATVKMKVNRMRLCKSCSGYPNLIQFVGRDANQEQKVLHVIRAVVKESF